MAEPEAPPAVAEPEAPPAMAPAVKRKSWQEGVGLGSDAAAAVAESEVSVSKMAKEWKGADDLSDSDYDDELQGVVSSLRMAKRSSWQEVAGLPLQGSGVFVKSVQLADEDKDWDGAADVPDDEDAKEETKDQGSWQELAGLPLRGSAVYVKEVECQKSEQEWALGDDVSTDEEGGEDHVPTVPFKRGSLLETPVDLQALAPVPEGADAKAAVPQAEQKAPGGRRTSWQQDIPLAGLSGGADGVEVKEVNAIATEKEWSAAGIDSDDDDDAVQMKLATWQEQTGLPLQGSGVYVKMVQLSYGDKDWTGAAGVDEDDEEPEGVEGEAAPKRRASWQEEAGIPLQGTGVYLKPIELQEETGEWGGEPEDSDNEDAAAPSAGFKRGSLLETPVDFDIKGIDTQAQGDDGPKLTAADLSDTDDSDEGGPEEVKEADKGNKRQSKKRQSWQELAALPEQGGAVKSKKTDVHKSDKEWAGAGNISDEEDDVVLNKRGSWQEEAGLPLSGTGVYVKPVEQMEVDEDWKGAGDVSGSDDERGGGNRHGESWQETAGLPLRGSAVFPKEVQLEKVEKDWDGAANVSDSEDERESSKAPEPQAEQKKASKAPEPQAEKKKPEGGSEPPPNAMFLAAGAALLVTALALFRRSRR